MSAADRGALGKRRNNTPVGESDELLVGMTVNSSADRVAVRYCLLTQAHVFKTTLLERMCGSA